MTLDHLNTKQDYLLTAICEELIDVPYATWDDRISETASRFADATTLQVSDETIKDYYFDL